MNNYKYAGSTIESGVIRNSDGANIPKAPGNRHWKEYQEYVDGGGQTDPWKTDEELFEDSLKSKLSELKGELDTKISSVIPTSNSRSKDKIISRQVKLLRRESQGRATATEIAELDASETLDDYLDNATDAYDAAEVWLEAPERTLGDIVAYNVAVDPSWPVMV